GVLEVAEIDPAVRVLVAEQGREHHVGLAFQRLPAVATGPAIPARRGNGVGGRAERLDIEDHAFVVADPLPEATEAGFGLPAHHDRGGVVAHEIPFGAPVYRVAE